MATPLTKPESLMPRVRMTTADIEAHSNRTASQTRAVATFVLPGRPEDVEGVIQAVYMDLKEGNMDANIVMRETPTPYIRVECPTQEDASALIHMAQKLAAAHLSGDPADAKTIFVEPPASYGADTFQIVLDVDSATKQARPNLETMPGTPSSATQVSSNRYMLECSTALCEALEKASCLHNSLIVRIHLGIYRLQTYKVGKFSLEQFGNMVRSPRAMGQLDTRLGKAQSAESLSVDAAMRLIHASGSPCFPIDNQAETSAQVTPVYILETWHNNDCFETELETTRKRKEAVTEGPLKFKLVRTTMIPEGAQVPSFEVTGISVVGNLDWNIVAIPGNDKVRTSAAVKQYLKMGHAEIHDARQNYRSYPAVSLPNNHQMALKFKSVAIKSIYRYKWKQTGYVVQFTINRRWQSIREMSQNRAKVDTDFDVTVYADHWDRDSRAEAGRAVARLWGDDLQGLLPGETGDATNGAISRAQGLIKIIMDVRDFFGGRAGSQRRKSADPGWNEGTRQ
ncbi:hypothetical protein GGS21DRAFT_493372 [Xylaria nigripes]|nr:hypothetical protein GGS21DRAFT_493372 [Xylaria nigripes]